MLLQKNSLLGLPIGHTNSAEDTFKFVSDSLSQRKSCIISFINPYAFHLRLVDQAYSNALWHFDLILPDGIGVVKALRWINGVDVERQSFDATSLFHPIMDHLDLKKKSLCIVGGRPGTALCAEQKMRGLYPNVNYLGALDGFRSFNEIVDWVGKHNPDVVLIGMGSPIQESILLRLKLEGFSGVGFTCGGFLDQLVLDSQYYPTIIDRFDLRWLYRLMSEPRRLGRRYLICYQTFVFDVFSSLISKWLGRRGVQSHQWLAKRYARSGG
ncbi:MAG: WecB/TagA/CpsF family glycosyltransferase [Geminicoccaceae bacterium]